MSAALEVIFGPPGTGKTTELTRLAKQYAEAEGSDTLLLCAFTRTAAHELAGRGVELDKRQIGTLHSLCFHGLDRPRLAEMHSKEWNEAYPMYTISSARAIQDSEMGETGKLYGDQCLNEINVSRHQLLPVTTWSEPAQMFWHDWQAWKYDGGYLDYTDLIERAWTVLPVAPHANRPYTLIVDEAQDMSLLQWKLLMQWAEHGARFIAGGDDDQALYRWAGADFRPMLAASSRRVLPQSYRVPRSHQVLADTYSQYITYREPKTWHPRAADGEIIETGLGWHDAGFWASQAQQWLENPDAWGTHTFLAPCSYMLQPLLTELRTLGIPFGNRWRTARHDWNPLLPPQRGIGMVQRILDFLKSPDRLWTWQELATWAEIVRMEGVFVRGAKERISAKSEELRACTHEELRALFVPYQLDAALSRGLEWFEEYALQQPAKSLAYPCRVYHRYGRDALTDEPRIRVGTCHSFKGTESDTVVYFTDLSRSQCLALCEGSEAADDVWRMRYVAVTRSRDTLILAGPQE